MKVGNSSLSWSTAVLRPLRLLSVASALAAWLFALPARADSGCFPPAAQAGLSGTAQEVYARAREALAQKRFPEAATLFRAVATEHAESPVGLLAAQQSLDALNRSGEACFPAMAELAPRFEQLYCAGDDAKRNEEACGTFARIVVDVARLGAENKVRAADAGRGNAARKLYLEAGRAYAAMWVTHYEPACRGGKKDTCARGDEVLYNAAKSFHAGRDLVRASAMRAALMDPKNHLETSALARRAVYEQAASFYSLGEYARAADFYERYAGESPKEEHAPEALSDAIVVRLALGDHDAAQKDADLFSKQYGAKRPNEAASIGLAVGLDALEDGDAARAVKTLESAKKLVRSDRPDLAPQLDVALGKSLLLLHRNDDAMRAFRSAASVDALGIAPRDEEGGTRALGRMLIAVGEAKVAVADEARDAAMKLKLKKGDVASLQTKRTAIATAEKQYGRVLEMAPVPPPGPVVAAAGRIAQLRSRLWAETYLALGDAAAEPLLLEAKAANEKCVDLSVKFQHQDEGARSCARWLARHFGPQLGTRQSTGDFAPMDELPPKLGLVAEGVFPAPRPLDEDGEVALPIASSEGTSTSN